MYRYDIINALIKKHKYKNYLEIGVRDNHCFDKIKIKDKSGVDPMQDEWEIKNSDNWDHSKVPVKYRMTSDEYFKNHKTKYDIIFIKITKLSMTLYLLMDCTKTNRFIEIYKTL